MAKKKTTKKNRVEEIVRLTEEIGNLLNKNALTLGEIITVLAALWGVTCCTVDKSVASMASTSFFVKCLEALDHFRKEAFDKDVFMAAFEKEYKAKD